MDIFLQKMGTMFRDFLWKSDPLEQYIPIYGLICEFPPTYTHIWEWHTCASGISELGVFQWQSPKNEGLSVTKYYGKLFSNSDGKFGVFGWKFAEN